MKQIYTLGIVILSAGLYACSSDDDIGRIVIGNGNTMFSLNELQYQDPYVIQVTDVDGNPQANTTVKIRLRSTLYNKGAYGKTGEGWAPFYTIINCPAEDLNNNGNLDAGEDTNGNGTLEPTNPATVANHPILTPTLTPGSNSITTDESGFGYFSITYPKSEANWSSVLITATATFSGSENIATKTQSLPALLADLEDEEILPLGGDGNSPYGLVGDCANPN
ncbi:MAG: hypothetical protein DIZ80_10270 [endosymbiont of Galathealinum brachiosum]|uniref:Uncharacterized protein n=1 Tax=endosymbiont of Galathealinum brachiosum TaxID=2200906 RepID=A0A370DER4_9GAMM|nr:MAG: hypothetical protein DIZ80_10270 [endosymbiont of Galathealinum brachiosum]